MEGEAQGHDVGVVLAELEGGSVLRQGIQVHAEKIQRELTVDVVELVSVLAVVFLEVSRIDFPEVVKIIGTFRVYAFMHDEVLPVFLGNKGIAAVGACKAQRRGDKFAGAESLSADFALVLAVSPIIVVDEMVRGTTQRTDGIFGNGPAITALYWFEGPAILPLVVFKKELPVLLVEGLDDRKLIHLEFLIFRGMGIIKGPLFEGDVSAYEADQPAVLLVKVLNKL